MPQNAAKRQTNGRGRATPKQHDRQVSRRYTRPIPRDTKHSPQWYPWLILGLLLCGVIVIILNYIALLPSSPSNWYTLGGLVAILSGALAATQYR